MILTSAIFFVQWPLARLNRKGPGPRRAARAGPARRLTQWYFCSATVLLSIKDHLALASLPFINGMSVPSCAVAPVRAPCTYAAVFIHYVIKVHMDYVIMYFMPVFGAPIF
jgi:hypothetical protein